MHIWGVFIGLIKYHKTIDKLVNWCMQVVHLKSTFGAFLILEPPCKFVPIWAGHSRDIWRVTAMTSYCLWSWPWGAHGHDLDHASALQWRFARRRSSHPLTQLFWYFLPSTFQLQKHVSHAFFIYFSSNSMNSSSPYKITKMYKYIDN